MVIDTDGYIQIIGYLTEHLSLFEGQPSVGSGDTVLSTIEEELSEQIMTLCSQNESLTFNQRNTIIREVDAVVSDLEEILSGVINNAVDDKQRDFIKEFSSLIKNLFDTEIHTSLVS